MPEIERGIHLAACLIFGMTLDERFGNCSGDRAERQAVAAQPRPWDACAVACHGTKPDADRRRTGGRPGEGVWHLGAAGWRAGRQWTDSPTWRWRVALWQSWPLSGLPKDRQPAWRQRAEQTETHLDIEHKTQLPEFQLMRPNAQVNRQ